MFPCLLLYLSSIFPRTTCHFLSCKCFLFHAPVDHAHLHMHYAVCVPLRCSEGDYQHRTISSTRTPLSAIPQGRCKNFRQMKRSKMGSVFVVSLLQEHVVLGLGRNMRDNLTQVLSHIIKEFWNSWRIRWENKQNCLKVWNGKKNCVVSNYMNKTNCNKLETTIVIT